VDKTVHPPPVCNSNQKQEVAPISDFSDSTGQNSQLSQTQRDSKNDKSSVFASDSESLREAEDDLLCAVESMKGRMQ